MAVTYKDIDELTQKSSISGTEKIEVSENQYITPEQIAGLAYKKPANGIPKADLESAVQTSLDKANSALQSHQDISGKEDKTNKVTSLSPSSNNSQYPSALCVYSLIAALTGPFSYEIVSSKPTASASTMGIIYLVTNGSNTEFWATKEISGSYSWQQLGTLATSITTITNGEIDALFE